MPHCVLQSLKISKAEVVVRGLPSDREQALLDRGSLIPNFGSLLFFFQLSKICGFEIEEAHVLFADQSFHHAH